MKEKSFEKSYESPEVQILEVMVEKGFASSPVRIGDISNNPWVDGGSSNIQTY